MEKRTEVTKKCFLYISQVFCHLYGTTMCKQWSPPPPKKKKQNGGGIPPDGDIIFLWENISTSVLFFLYKHMHDFTMQINPEMMREIASQKVKFQNFLPPAGPQTGQVKNSLAF